MVRTAFIIAYLICAIPAKAELISNDCEPGLIPVGVGRLPAIEDIGFFDAIEGAISAYMPNILGPNKSI